MISVGTSFVGEKIKFSAGGKTCFAEKERKKEIPLYQRKFETKRADFFLSLFGSFRLSSGQIPGGKWVLGSGVHRKENLLLICFPVRSKSNNEHVRHTHGRMPRSVVSREF